MRAHYIFRNVQSVARFLDATAPAGRQFELSGTEAHYAPDRPVAIRHVNLQARIDPDKQTVQGHVTAVCVPMVDEIQVVRFDASDLQIGDVHLEGQPEPVDTRYDGRYLDVLLPAARRLNEAFSLLIAFEVRAPRLGLYFVGATEAEPERPTQVWSQNQDDDARYWFPCMDEPGLKMTTSVAITVPTGFVVLANGVPDPAEPFADHKSGWHTFAYRHDTPQPIYLLSVVIGPFVEHLEPGEGPEVRWWALPGREEDARRTFGKTRAIIDFFGEYLGIPYAWERYGQVAISEFVFGGMENTTLTSVTDRVLVDARAEPDNNATSLVAHELAHQWFGDLVTCRHWSHGWLNEGFATYFDQLFVQHDRGQSAFDYEMMQLAEGYLHEAATKYQRPLVTRRYREPIDIFDRHLYHKGAWVLHMLRARLGETLFRRGLYVYLQRFSFGQAETHDLRRALEDATGRSLGQFFDDWLFRPGDPRLAVEIAYDEGAVTVTVEQRGERRAWHLDTTLLIRTQGETRRLPLKIYRKTQVITIPQASAPDLVVFDPDYTLLATLELDVPLGFLETQLTDAPSIARRIEAARALGKKPSNRAMKALITALGDDSFWGVRHDIATALGAVGTQVAETALLAALNREQHPKARRGLVKALGAFEGSSAVADALFPLADGGDPSWFVEAEAVRALARLKSPHAMDVCSAAAGRASYLDVVAAAGLDGLARQKSSDALERILEAAGSSQRTIVRVNAILAAGQMARDHEWARAAVLDLFGRLAREGGLFLPLALLSALERFGRPEGLGLVAALGEGAADGRVRRRSEEVRLSVSRRAEVSAPYGTLREELEALRVQTRTLRTRLDTLEGD